MAEITAFHAHKGEKDRVDQLESTTVSIVVNVSKKTVKKYTMDNRQERDSSEEKNTGTTLNTGEKNLFSGSIAVKNTKEGQMGLNSEWTLSGYTGMTQ